MADSASSNTPLLDDDGLLLPSPEMQMLRINKLDGYNYRFRRIADWDENYELYRDKVIVNRLTQRQSVNLPIMKTQIRTLLKDVDDMPVLYFENLDNDKQKEMFQNDYWQWTVERNRMELQDIIDKRQDFLFGRTYDQWQIADGMVKMTVQDPYDILIQRYADPFDIHSSRYLIHLHIFEPLSSLANNHPDWDQDAIADLQKWYGTQTGLLKAAENQRLLVQKNQRLADMGVPDVHSPVLGETYVELALHFVFRDDEAVLDEAGQPTTEKQPKQIYLYVEADNMRILLKKPLEAVIGTTSDNFWRTHYPYVTWADDIERQDWYSDSVADIIRTPNKVMNAWFSQMVENRSLKNLNMHIFNSNIEGFQPQTWQPMAWGMYGVPLPQNGKLSDVFQAVPVDDLKDSLEEMNFLNEMIEKASGASPTQQGVQTERQVTLGEVKLQLQQAQQRIKGMSKFYTQAWKDRALIFLKLIEAAPEKLDAVRIYKKGRISNSIHSREISPKDWMSESGYGTKIWSQDQRDQMNVEEVNKLSAIKREIPDNMKLDEIYKRKLLEFGNLNPNEVNEVMQVEEEKAKAAAEGESANRPVPQESLQLPYQYAPEDIKRQYEAAFGFKPSTMGGLLPPGAPQPAGAPGQPTAPQQAPSPSPQPQLPAGPGVAQ